MAILNFGLAGCYIGKAANSKQDGAVSNVLLRIFCANVAGYAMYYVGMKYYYVKRKKIMSERISWTCWIYTLLAFGFSITGIYFFVHKEKTTLVSPSQSRHMNAECKLLIFDAHDLWHFTSSFALLFTFMALLTLEDNNTATPWNEIHVF